MKSNICALVLIGILGVVPICYAQPENAEWYGSMKTSSDDAWDRMKNGFSDAYKALAEAWEKSEKEFNSKE